jgi:hypothetical protein
MSVVQTVRIDEREIRSQLETGAPRDQIDRFCHVQIVDIHPENMELDGAIVKASLCQIPLHAGGISVSNVKMQKR